MPFGEGGETICSRAIGLALSLLFVVLCCLLGGATTYYVAPSGNDSGAGTEGSPWRTIQHALDVVGAGDTVFVRGGTYSEYLQSIRSGSAGAPIVVSSHPGETAIIDGFSVGWNTGVTITHDYVQLVGLEIANWPSVGIWVEGAGYIEIRDCTVHDVEYGIGFAAGAHDFLLDQVEIYEFDLFGFDASPSGGADCYAGTLRDCIAHSARDPGQNVDGFALGHGNQYGFEFIRCEASGVFDGFDISADDTQLSQCSSHNNTNAGFKSWADEVSLENCIAYGNSVCNLELDWDEDPGVTTLWNCTFFDAPIFNIWVENAGDTLEMRNCILAGGDNIGLAFEQFAPPSYIGDHNLFHNRNPDRAIAVGYTDEFSLTDIESGAWTDYSGQDGNSVASSSESAIFADSTVPDLHLAAGSLAVDSGTSVGAPITDYDEVQRPQGSAHDIGAFEQVVDVETAAVFRVEEGAVLADQTFHAAAFASGAADIAEWVHMTTQAEPGDVVAFDPMAAEQYRIAQDVCSSLVAGIISTTPGVTLGTGFRASEKALLALMGMVPVKVTNEGGPIQPGDLLVTSSSPGHAMRWAGPDPCLCSLVGKALEPLDEEQGVILVLLTAH